MNPYDVIVRPMLSEKSVALREGLRKYCFVVQREATKVDVKKAVEQMFEVTVEGVNTTITRGKYRRRGQWAALGPKRKKAVVTIKEGQKIALFEDQ